MKRFHRPAILEKLGEGTFTDYFLYCGFSQSVQEYIISTANHGISSFIRWVRYPCFSAIFFLKSVIPKLTAFNLPMLKPQKGFEVWRSLFHSMDGPHVPETAFSS
jgi:hypothetical protein